MDGLRGIAVLMVVLFHGNEQRLITPELWGPGFSFQLPSPPMTAGAIGVEIFFFISGFVLLYPIAQRVFEGKAPQSLADFARRRALKILPSYVIALVVITLLLPLDVPQDQPLWLAFGAHLFFLHGLWGAGFGSINGPLWTLAIEVEFYLVFPLIARAFEQRPNLTLFAMVATSVAYRIVIDLTGNDRNFFITNQLPDHLDLFGFGMFAAWTLVKYRGRERSLAAQRRWTGLALGALLAFYALLGDVLHYGGPDAWKWSSDHRDLEALLLFAFALGTGLGVQRWRDAFSNRFLLFLGTISYNLYLWNKAAFIWYGHHFAAFVGRLPSWSGNVIPTIAALSLPFAVAIAMTYGIERPILLGGWRTLYRPTLAALRRLPKPFAPGDPFAVAGPAPQGGRAIVASIVAFAFPAALFANSMRRVASDGDGSELITASYLFGVAHSTGYPVFIWLGWLFSHVPAGPTVGWRVIAISALSAAVSAWLVARIVRKLGGEAWIGTAAALVFATGDIVWSHATDAGFAPLALAFFAAAVERLAAYTETGSRRVLAVAALCAGLGASVQPVVLALVPGLVLVAARRGTTTLRRLADAGIALGSVGTGLLPYLAIPVRAAALAAAGGGPLRAIGKPPGEALFYPDDPSTLWAFVHAWAAQPARGSILGNFWQVMSVEAGVFTVACAVVGAAVVARHAWTLGTAMLVAGVLPALIALGFPGYANVDAYFVFTLFVAAVFLGVAATAIVRLYGQERRAARRGWSVAILALGAFTAMLDNDYRIRDANSKASLPGVVVNVGEFSAANGIIIAPWDQAMQIAEAAYVEKILTDRIVDTSSLDSDLQYIAAWSKKRPVYAVALPAGYRAKGFRIALVRGEAGDPDAVFSVTPGP